MELSTRYTPADTEARWYEHWEKRGYFTAKPDGREPFSIVIPPPRCEPKYLPNEPSTSDERMSDREIKELRSNS